MNAKVRNYDLRDLETKMNKRTVNLIEINKMRGWTYEEGLLPETGIPMFGIGAVPVSYGTGAATVGFSIP